MKKIKIKLELLTPKKYDSVAFVSKSLMSIYDVINVKQLKNKDRPYLNYNPGSERRIKGTEILKELEKYEQVPYIVSYDLKRLKRPIEKIFAPYAGVYQMEFEGLHDLDSNESTKTIFYYKILNPSELMYTVLRILPIAMFDSSIMYVEKNFRKYSSQDTIDTFGDLMGEL